MSEHDPWSVDKINRAPRMDSLAALLITAHFQISLHQFILCIFYVQVFAFLIFNFF